MATTKTTTARNLWAPRNPHMRETFTYHTPPRFECSGVAVYRNPAGSWDFVYAGAVIAQRAGFSKEGALAVIDGLLNGTNALTSDVVRVHIAAHRQAQELSRG